MNKEELKEFLAEAHPESVFFENPSYETAIIGYSEDYRVIYEYNKMIEWLIKTDNMTEEEAREFISYNTIRALPYMGVFAPIILMNEL